MHRRYTTILFFVFFSLHLAEAQREAPCGLDHMHQKAIQENPDFAKELEAFTERVKKVAQKGQTRNVTSYTIPVVVHVIHNGANVGNGTNLSEERIQSQIDILNEDYSRTNADADQTPVGFRALAADVEIQFCLAKVDPDGNPSDGITRHRYNNVNSTNYIEDVVKPMTSWNPRQYLNIWTLDMPRESILGYAFLPTTSRLNTDADGVVIAYERFGFISSSNRGRTTTHEVGHYLGLEHPWGAVDNDGDPIGCTSDDGVEDTPRQGVAYYFCPSFPQNSCGTSDMFMNYMDYVNDDCMNLFTEGQKNVMHDVLDNERAQLAQNTAAICQIEECVASFDLEEGAILMGWEDDEAYQCWVIENANNDENTWAVYVKDEVGETGPNTGNNFLGYFWNEDEVTPGDDYIFSPFFDIKAGRIYEIKFDVAAAKAGDTSYPERLEVGASFSQNSSSFIIVADDWVIDPVSNTYPTFKTYDLYFDTDGPGRVSIGFHVFSDANQYALQIDNVSIKDVGSSTKVSDQILANSFKVFPNPFHDQFTVDLDLETPDTELTITIKDILGRTIISRSLPQMKKQQLQFDLSGQANGMYFVTISSNGRNATKRVMLVD